MKHFFGSGQRSGIQFKKQGFKKNCIVRETQYENDSTANVERF